MDFQFEEGRYPLPKEKKEKKVKKTYRMIKEKLTAEELAGSLPSSHFTQVVKIHKDGKEQICYILRSKL